MPNEQLLAHIRSELARGVDKTTLVQSLLAAGWKAEDINAAMTGNTPAPSQNIPTAPQSQPVTTQVAYVAPAEGSPMKTMVQNMASGLFIACVSVLTIVSILGVWKFFSGDVITKSFETLGLLAFVAGVVIVASRFVGDPTTVAMPSPAFRATRNITLATLIVSSSLLAFFGVLSIWDVITDKDVLNKVLSSLVIVGFSSLIVVMVCLEREQDQLWKKRGGQISGGAIIVGFLFLWMMFAFLR